MKLFHGTNIDFDNIDLKMSKPNKDFGQGFYLSDTRQQAEELAMARVELTGGSPVVIEYDFDEKLLHDKSLKVKLFEEYTEDWANFILANRNSTNGNIHDYDIVFGPIANDRVGRQLWRYRNHDIDMSTLVKNLKFMKGITFQYFFGTEQAIKHLKKR